MTLLLFLSSIFIAFNSSMFVLQFITSGKEQCNLNYSLSVTATIAIITALQICQLQLEL